MFSGLGNFSKIASCTSLSGINFSEFSLAYSAISTGRDHRYSSSPDTNLNHFDVEPSLSWLDRLFRGSYHSFPTIFDEIRIFSLISVNINTITPLCVIHLVYEYTSTRFLMFFSNDGWASSFAIKFKEEGDLGPSKMENGSVLDQPWFYEIKFWTPVLRNTSWWLLLKRIGNVVLIKKWNTS